MVFCQRSQEATVLLSNKQSQFTIIQLQLYLMFLFYNKTSSFFGTHTDCRLLRRWFQLRGTAAGEQRRLEGQAGEQKEQGTEPRPPDLEQRWDWDGTGRIGTDVWTGDKHVIYIYILYVICTYII